MSNALTIETIEKEVDQNYDVFRSLIDELLEQRAGQYALMRNQSIVDFFQTAGDAVRAGRTQFGDCLFSVQEVTNRPYDLGYFSHGGHHTDV